MSLMGTPTPDKGITHPSSHLPDSSGRRPRLPRIMTNPPLEPRSSDGPRTQYFTPGASGEARDSRTFNSAVGVQVVYSRSGLGSQDVAGHARRVLDVRQPAAERMKSKHSFPTRPPEPPQRKGSSRQPDTDPGLETSDVRPRHGLRMSLVPPSQTTKGFSHLREPERQRDSTFSYSSSPFDEFRSDAGPSQTVPDAGNPTIPIPGRESGSRRPRPHRGEVNDVGGDRGAAFPRFGMRRVVPGWGGGEDADEREHKEKGEERGNRSYLPTPTGPASNEAEDPSRDRNLTPVSPMRPAMGYTTQDAVSILIQRRGPSFVKQMLTKLGVHESSQFLRSLSPSKRATSRARKGAPPPIPESNKRDVKTSIMSIFGGHKGSVG